MVKPSVYVSKDWATPTQRLFDRFGFKVVDAIELADIVAFNGGEDLHPQLYKQTIIPGAGVNWLDEERDKRELVDYEKSKGKFKFGICRGGQLLNVMNGGTLWQDVNGHHGAHDMLDLETNSTIFTSSVHHQQFILGPKCTKVAVARQSTKKTGFYRGKPVTWQEGMTRLPEELIEDPEVVFYANDRALCIQGHPEYSGYNQMTNYCFDLIERYYG